VDRQTCIEILDALESAGWQVRASVLKIWEGERSEDILFQNADPSSCMLIRTVLRIVQSMERIYPRCSSDVIPTLCMLVTRMRPMNQADVGVAVRALEAAARVVDALAQNVPVLTSSPDIAAITASRGG
jgi:hypothetical protein